MCFKAICEKSCLTKDGAEASVHRPSLMNFIQCWPRRLWVKRKEINWMIELKVNVEAQTNLNASMIFEPKMDGTPCLFLNQPNPVHWLFQEHTLQTRWIRVYGWYGMSLVFSKSGSNIGYGQAQGALVEPNSRNEITQGNNPIPSMPFGLRNTVEFSICNGLNSVHCGSPVRSFISRQHDAAMMEGRGHKRECLTSNDGTRRRWITLKLKHIEFSIKRFTYLGHVSQLWRLKPRFKFTMWWTPGNCRGASPI